MYFVEKTKGVNFIKQFDYYLFVPALILTIIGALAVFSATRTMKAGDAIFRTHIAAIIIGLFICFFLARFDYKDFKVLGKILYGISAFLLVLVLFVGHGDQSVNMRGWLKLGFVNIQPSELMKVGYIIVIAIFLEKIVDERTEIVKNLAYIGILTIIPMALILKQPDFGTTMVFAFIILVMGFVAGLPYIYINIGAVVAAIGATFAYFFVFKEYQRTRILSFLNPEKYESEGGWNVVQSKLAIGSGGFFGKGYLNGMRTQNSMVPVKESDFIFSVIGEEMGFFICAIVVILSFFIILRCIYIARNARDSYGAFVLIGIAAMMGIHVIENIGMSVGLLPVTGIPLPFISSGGSAMIGNFAALGVALSVSLRRKRTIFDN